MLFAVRVIGNRNPSNFLSGTRNPESSVAISNETAPTMGGGVPVVLEPEAVEPVLMQVVSELRASWPERVIEAEFSLSTAVNCDRGRVGQLFSTLLAIALTYGKADAPIRVFAS